MRLLLVEDDLSIQRFVERALVEAGYRVDATADAKSAEALALERVHDAFIIDLGLPGHGWTRFDCALPGAGQRRSGLDPVSPALGR